MGKFKPNKHMTKTKTTHNGKKVSTFIKNTNYEIYFSRPVAGVKSQSSHLNLSGVNPQTGERSRVQLDGKAIVALRKVLA